jgi:hypothetical protein
MQQGFLGGRSIIKNLIDVDTEAMTISLKSDRGAIILFDFKAAFPSISQEYIHRVLQRTGMPEGCQRLVRSLYNDSKCLIACGGGLYPGFELTAGVRQGCPLSPLLYAIAADLMLTTLTRCCAGGTIRAFADDTATVVTEFWRDAPLIQNAFNEFERISGLALNHAKCVIIPLNVLPLVEFQSLLRRSIPQWADMVIAESGTYLGFSVGPGKLDSSWDKPTKKFLERVRQWQGMQLGLQYDALAYNAFGMSVLSYICQLESPRSGFSRWRNKL